MITFSLIITMVYYYVDFFEGGNKP